MTYTDKQLEERATELARKRLHDQWETSPVLAGRPRNLGRTHGYYEATHERLKDNRESLKYMKEFAHMVDDCGGAYPELSAHITHLQTTLGQTEEKPDQP